MDFARGQDSAKKGVYRDEIIVVRCSSIATPLELVGLQVRACRCLLSSFLFFGEEQMSLAVCFSLHVSWFSRETNLARSATTVLCQIWRASLLLCDYILEASSRTDVRKWWLSSTSEGCVLELGAGIGICSILASRFSCQVFATGSGLFCTVIVQVHTTP